jgi:hypothetical protein
MMQQAATTTSTSRTANVGGVDVKHLGRKDRKMFIANRSPAQNRRRFAGTACRDSGQLLMEVLT